MFSVIETGGHSCLLCFILQISHASTPFLTLRTCRRSRSISPWPMWMLQASRRTQHRFPLGKKESLPLVWTVFTFCRGKKRWFGFWFGFLNQLSVLLIVQHLPLRHSIFASSTLSSMHKCTHAHNCPGSLRLAGKEYAVFLPPLLQASFATLVLGYCGPWHRQDLNLQSPDDRANVFLLPLHMAFLIL